MSTITIAEQLAEVRRRIDRLQSHTPAGTAAGSAGTPRGLDGIRRAAASACATARRAPDEVEENLARLQARLDIAEHSLAADLSEEQAAFATAVEAELHGWDTYLERLQTSVATKACEARGQAETAIAQIRARRIAVDEHLARVRGGTPNVWQEDRRRVTEARDELERKADELSAKLTSTKFRSKEQWT